MPPMTAWNGIFRNIARKGFDNLDPCDAPGFQAQSDILPAFAVAMVQKALRGFAPSGQPHDDLLELAMRLLEAMAPYRSGLAEVEKVMRADPSRLVPLFLPIAGEMDRLVETAGLRTSARSGVTHTLRLMITLARVFPVFLKDDTPGLQKTLAGLASRLKGEA